MDHIAIMKKNWGLIPKILNGQKTIESRWYQTKRLPWNNVKIGDTVFFKNSGEPVIVRANVSRIIQFQDLTPSKVKEILLEYGKSDGIDELEIPTFFERFKNKKYCILVFLKKPQKITPFEINKKGFGSQSAWLIVNDINRIKIPGIR